VTFSTLAEIARLLSFLLFLALGIRVARASGTARRRAVVAFAGYVVAINAAAGVTQIDNWPFTSNTLAVGRMRGDDRPLTWLAFRGVDRDGREWKLDPQSFSPVFDSILQYWLTSRFSLLDDDGRRVSARFLVAKANEARARLTAGKRIGFERFLGPFAAGYWWRLPRVQEAPEGEFLSIRVYRLEYTLGEIAAHGRILRENFLLELRG
jgi:hypothetical protein